MSDVFVERRHRPARNRHNQAAAIPQVRTDIAKQKFGTIQVFDYFRTDGMRCPSSEILRRFRLVQKIALHETGTRNLTSRNLDTRLRQIQAKDRSLGEARSNCSSHITLTAADIQNLYAFSGTRHAEQGQ